VQEAMGFKVDREAVANLVLPQLWSMSIGPLLNVEQFHRFMSVIRRLGERVEKEHDQFLRDAQRIEDRSALAANSSNTQSFASTVDFENLVGGSGGVATNPDTVTENKSWGDNVWGSIFDDNNPTPLASPTPPTHVQTHVPSESKSEALSQLGLGARNSWTLPPPLPPPSNLRSSDVKSHPTSVNRSPPQGVPFAKPNYNISLSTTPTPPIPPTTNVYTRGSTPLTNQNTGTNVIQPTMTSILTPSRPAQTSSNTIQKLSKNDWGDFDPLA